MSATASVTYTPEDFSSGSVTLEIGSMGTMSLQGFRKADTAQPITLGRSPFAVVHDTRNEYELSILGIDQQRIVSSRCPWNQLVSFISHVERGGKFDYAGIAADVGNTTVGLAAVEGDGYLDLNSVSTLAVGEWIMVQHLRDHSRYEIKRIEAITALVLTLHSNIAYDYPAGSPVRHYNHLKDCALIEDSLKFQEQAAGRGAYAWDFQMRFRSVA